MKIRSQGSETTTTAALKGVGTHWEASGKPQERHGVRQVRDGEVNSNWRKPCLVVYIYVYTEFLFLVEYVTCTGSLNRQDVH